ncbi:MAG: hypothetical protein AB1696_02825 [Planctomycetota bacterium]
MPSSISNSNDRLPEGPYLKMWALATSVAGAFLIALEILWRVHGYTPSVTDDKDLWCLCREAASGADTNTIVVLGASRIQLGFDHAAFLERCPGYRLINLAIVDTSFVPVLRDLAEDETFRGIALCEMMARWLSPEYNTREAQEYVHYYHSVWSLSRKIERILATFVQQHLVIAQPSLAPQKVLPQILKGKWPKPYYILTRPDRSRAADYTKTDVEAIKRETHEARLRLGKGKPPWAVSLDMLPRGTAELEKLVERIQQRGGRVVLVRMVSGGESREMEEEVHPRSKYWDAFAHTTSAVAIHFEDVPAMRQFTCPDDVHLDYRDAPEYTKALADELIRRGVVRGTKDGGATSRPDPAPKP